MRMVLGGEAGSPRIDRSLIRAVARARRWSQQLLSGQFRSISEIARCERMGPRYGPRRSAAGVSVTQDRRGDRRSAAAAGIDDPRTRATNRYSAFLERAAARTGI